jgi:hypothetical protein
LAKEDPRREKPISEEIQPNVSERAWETVLTSFSNSPQLVALVTDE